VSEELARLRVHERGGIVMADVEGEVDLSNASSLKTDLTVSVSNAALGLLIDLTGLDFLDSSGVHMLYDIADRLATRQQRFAVVMAPDAPPRRAIEISGVEPATWLYGDRESALQAIGAQPPG
jgi:anti-anti-sigma factor